MGNISNGLRIKKVGKSNILNEITYGFNEKILEYICFITKINDNPINERFHEIQNKTNYIIKNFSIFNIHSKKEFKINLETTNNKLFFLETEVEYCKIPNIEKVLLISGTVENSIAMSMKIKPNSLILLGNNEKYFDKMEDISHHISQSKADFIFYNFIKKKIKCINFEAFRLNNKNSDFLLGIECEVVSLEEFLKETCSKTAEELYSEIAKESTTEIKQNLLETEIIPYDKIETNYVEIEKKIESNENLISYSIEEEANHLKEENTNFIEQDIILESNSSVKNCIFKYSLRKPKTKFMKNLKIYEHLDTHYNFLGSNYKKDNSESNSDLHKSVILIKGFSLLNIEVGQNSNSILSVNNLYNNLKIKFFNYHFCR